MNKWKTNRCARYAGKSKINAKKTEVVLNQMETSENTIFRLRQLRKARAVRVETKEESLGQSKFDAPVMMS